METHEYTTGEFTPGDENHCHCLIGVTEEVPEIYVIGDGKKPRQIINATFEGAAAARLI